jgi:AraC family ethanolamine operon transcriptional activator
LITWWQVCELWTVRNLLASVKICDSNMPLAVYSPNPPVLERHRSCDADTQARSLRGWEQVYDQLGAGAFEGDTLEAHLGDVQVFRERSGLALRQKGRAPSGTHLFAVNADSAAKARFRGSVVDEGAMLMVQDGAEFEFRTPAAYVGLGIVVRAEALRGCGDGLEERLAQRDVLRAGPAPVARLRQFLAEALDALDRDAAVLQSETARCHLAADILDRVHAVLGSAGPEPAGQPSATRRARIVARAEEYVLARSFESVTVAELCRHVGASRRHLQQAFQDIVGMTPNLYLRAVRLCRVRRELKAGLSVGATIQDVAARWGFWHLGHFSLDYKRLFAERPSDTLRRGAS